MHWNQIKLFFKESLYQQNIIVIIIFYHSCKNSFKQHFLEINAMNYSAAESYICNLVVWTPLWMFPNNSLNRRIHFPDISRHLPLISWLVLSNDDAVRSSFWATRYNPFLKKCCFLGIFCLDYFSIFSFFSA